LTATVFGLRLGRWGIVGFSAGAFLSSLIQAVAFYQIAGHSPAERVAFGRSMTALASRFTVILPTPSRLDTVGGYVQWRSFGGLAILFAVWALASASGAARGDEERGLVEAVLAASVSRLGLIASRTAAFAASSFVAALAAGLGLVVGAANGGDSFSLGPVLEESIVLAALALSCYSLTLLVAQIGAARIATAAAGTLLLVLFLVNSLSHTYASLSSVRWLSPFHYYELNQPLSPGGVFDLRATFMLLAIAIVASIAAALAFAYRDLGSPLVLLPARTQPTSYEVSRVLAWRIPLARGLYERRVGLVVWTVGMAVLGVISAALTKSIIQPLLSIPALASYFGSFLHVGVYTTFLGFLWLSLAQLLLAAFAITQVARWSAEDGDGRLELIIANPLPRTAVVVERALVLVVGATVLAAAGGLAVGYASHFQAIDLDGTRLAAASSLLIPFALVFAAAGSVLAAWNPRAAVGLLGGFAFASYLVSEVGPLLKWPDWVQDFSAFKLFGTPLESGVDRAGLAIMVVIIVMGFGASMLLMQRRDVGA
jgi:ABC-2 type transport system permease protein